MSALWRSVVLLVRSFTRARGFAVAAVLTAAIGIGANAVVFSLFDRVLFRPLPYAAPDRLVQVQAGLSAVTDEPALPVAVTRALARESGLFSGIGWAVKEEPVALTPVAGENPRLWLAGVTTGSLEVLGVRPVIGPGFAAMPATPLERPVLLTYETWQREYGGTEDVLALEWLVRDEQQRNVHWRVVGVLPEGFLLPSPRLAATPHGGIYGVDAELDGPIPGTTRMIGLAPFARLAPGVSMAAARARINAVVATWFPRDPNVQHVRIVPLQSGLASAPRTYAWLAVVGAWAVLGAASLTLAILLLTWSQSRHHDAGVRLALGASPRRLVISTLAESVVICVAGAAIGWLVYGWTQSAFVALMPVGLRSFAAGPADVRVMLVTGVVALASALVAGTLPALRAVRISPLQVMRGPHEATTADRLVGGSLLLSAQAALGVTLLVGALAILPGVLRALTAPPGFDATDLFTADVSTAHDESASDAPEQTRRGLATLDAIRRLPGVVDAALTRANPFWPSVIERQILGGELRNRSGFEGFIRPVDGDFFRLLDVPLAAGRPVLHADVERQALVAVINETGARRRWPGVPATDVIGRTVTTADGPRVIVGVAADFHVGMDASAEPTLFLPLSASEAYAPPGSAFPSNAYQVLVRMAPGRIPDRALLSDTLRELPWSHPAWLGVQAPFLDAVPTHLERAFEAPRLLALIFGSLAGMALLLTIIAMYGLASFEMRRRREEMTVRLALGATPRALRRRLAVAIVKPVAIGILGGLPFSWVIARLLSISVSVGNANDIRIYAVAATVILVAALAAAWLPGRRVFTMRVAELLRPS